MLNGIIDFNSMPNIRHTYRMKVLKNILISGKHQKDFFADVFYIENQQPKPVVIFSHGFKGFKDWGHFNLVATAFANAGFVFVKFNFSHNGTTLNKPDEFADIEAFGHNSFQIELDDLSSVVDYVLNAENEFFSELDSNKLFLLGHSRGGGISILKAWKDNRIKKLAAWASVNEFGKFWTPEVMEHWKRDNVMYILNSRTKQELPMYYSAYEKFYAEKHLFDIPKAVQELTIPFLIVHGTADTTVDFAQAEIMQLWNSRSELFSIENGDHTFGGKHPCTNEKLPLHTEMAVQKSIAFYLD
jgi:predicted dienelactone hydrolase